MKRSSKAGGFARAAIVVAVMGMVGPVLAQERGRTDGPEGSEIGKGGYADPSAGSVSLQLDWGGSFAEFDQDPPLFVGGTASYWMDDWFLVDLSGAYLFNTETFQALVGPRFRSPFTYPLAFSLGLKAGVALLGGDDVYFTLSPQVGGDFLVSDKVLLGLTYSPDFYLGADSNPNHRVFLNLGYRF